MIQGSSIAPGDRRAGTRPHPPTSSASSSAWTATTRTTHVLAELEAYAPLTTVGSYCVVFDTIVEDMPADMFRDRPWGPGDNPKTAVWQYLEDHPEFEIDRDIQHKLLITVAPDGYLRRVC